MSPRTAQVVAGRFRRRDVLYVGGLTALGLGLPQLLSSRAQAGPAARAKSCILIWLDGGPSHLETFDPKPEAPSEVRGPLGAISTSIPGVAIGDMLPETARRLDRVALIRSMTSPLGEHNFGTHYLMTGYKPNPVLEYPHCGSVLTHVRGPGSGALPPNVAVPNFRVGGARLSGNGYLPAATKPFSLGPEKGSGDPARPEFQVRDLGFYPGLSAARVERRRDFLDALDRMKRRTGGGDGVAGSAAFDQAYRLVSSRSAVSAFDLKQESPAIRDRYGRRTVGQSCLLARRLIERGVAFVTVNHKGWDTHNDLYTRLKEGYTGAKVPVGLIPTLDTALSALIDDLAERGLFDETLIAVMGEFGRTPKLNTSGGRDHWPRVFSVLLAGGGIRGGTVVGRSDSVAENPDERPVTPPELTATIYTLLGIDPALTLHTPDGRPVRVSPSDEVIGEILG